MLVAMAMPRNTLPVKSMQQLEEKLAAYGVSSATWGKGDTKTIADLFEGLKQGELALFETDGKLQLYSWSVKVDVHYTEGQKPLRLVETSQVNHKTHRKRDRKQFNALSAKRRGAKGEKPLSAASRALREIIQVTDVLSLRQTYFKLWPARQKADYEGLKTVTATHYFVAQLHQKDFKLEGYLEKTPERTTTFHWVVVR